MRETVNISVEQPQYTVASGVTFAQVDVWFGHTVPESLLLGRNVMRYKEDAVKICPVTYVTKDAPPFMIIHGTKDGTVPFAQGEMLHDKLEEAGCDVKLIAIEGADHADMQFFQKETWQRIINFFHDKLGYAK